MYRYYRIYSQICIAISGRVTGGKQMKTGFTQGLHFLEIFILIYLTINYL